MSAGKGPDRRKGSDDKAYRDNFVFIKGFKSNEEKEFEEKFMGKQASEEAPVSGKYFMEQ